MRLWTVPRPALDLGVVSLASLVGIALSAGTSFLAPIYMSQNDYGIWRIVLLYSGFGGVLHLGLVDGVLILWAGSTRDKRAGDFVPLFAFFLTMQMAIGLALTVIILSRDADASSRWIWMAILIISLMANFLYFFQYALQAFREFRCFVVSNLTYQTCMFAGVLALGLLNLLSATAAVALSLFSLASGVVVAAWPSRHSFRWPQVRLDRVWAVGTRMIRVGFFFMVGTLLMAVFFTADNIAVSQAYQPAQYAFYAFPSTIVGIVYVLVGAMTTVSFPYLSAQNRSSLNTAYSSARSMTIVAWGISLTGYFLIALLVTLVLPTYVPALSLMRIMLLVVGLGSLIRSVHYNYYRLDLKRGSFVLINAASLLVYLSLLVTLIRVGSSLEGIAWCALLCTGIWFLLNEWQLHQFMRSGWLHDFVRPMLGLLAFAIGFWLDSSWNVPIFWQIVVYSLWVIIVIRFAFVGDARLIWARLTRSSLSDPNV